MGKVPAAGEKPDVDRGQPHCSLPGMAHRDDRVPVAPHDERGHRGREVQAVGRAHGLATGLDHRVHGAQERLITVEAVLALELDERLGFAVVEPGVTYQAMYDELVRRVLLADGRPGPQSALSQR